MPPARATVPFGSLIATAELFRADGLTLTASGDSVTAAIKNQVTGPENLGAGLIDLSGAGNGLLIVHVGAATGTTPALELFLDTEDAYGNWAPAPAGATGILSAAITAAGTYVGALSTATLAAFTGRLRWTISGTTPSFSGVSLNVYGR